ncbi:MAG: hypothetical protein ABMA01_08905 [Chthoniobacteraceae bacterium]
MTAPELRATPPKVTEVTDPNAPGAPAPPAQLFPPLPEPLYIPDLGGMVPGLIPLPMPGTGVSARPPLQRVYRVGKFVIKYGTDVRERYPKLPTEEQLAASTVKLLDIRGTLYHAGKKPAAAAPASAPGDQVEPAEKGDLDEALHPPTYQAPGLAAMAGGNPSAAADAKPAPKLETKSGKKAESKPDKKIPKAIPKPFFPEDKPITLKVSDFGEPRWISAMGLADVYNSIVDRLTDRGLIGVYLMAAVNPGAGTDLRKDTLDIEIQVFVSEVAKIRTISRRLPFRTLDLPKLNDEDAIDGITVKDPKHLWIKEKSPLFVSGKKKAGALLEKQRLQDYLSRLNRFPGRRVDAAINATGETGKVMLDYLIREQKQYVIYAQETNNGTRSTGEWRSRLGIEYRQLANMDDILRLEYVTTDLERLNSGVLSYQFALEKPDVLKMRVYGLYGQYSAEDVGFAGANFNGDTLTAGTAITWTPLYWRGFPLDLTMGAEFLRVSVDNEANGLQSTANFILPYIGVGTERVTDRFTFATNWQVKGSFDSPDQDTLNGLGRFESDGGFWILNGDIAASAYLEPFIFGKKWGDTGKNDAQWWRGMLANEIAVSARGQYAMGNRRLIPQLELIAGGFNTVRGYPESLSVGDSGFVGSFEYRLHLPRLLKPTDPSGKQQEAKRAGNAAKTPETAAPAKTGKPDAGPKPAQKPGAPPETAPVATANLDRGDRFWQSFRVRPGPAGSGSDWDLIFRAFTDYGQTFNNRGLQVIETDRTLLSAGAGLEFQVFKPLYMTIRAEYGFVLQAQRDLLVDPVDFGDGRLHISATVAW